MSAAIEISPIEVLALAKLVLINTALAQRFDDAGARREQLALVSVLSDVTKRAEFANHTKKATKR